MLTLTPINLKTANAFVQQYHRHHKPTRGHKFSIGVSEDGALVGVAICGRPVARRLDDGYTLEVNRLCTDGTPNACSILYAAAYRAARAMGYNKVVTYILDTENGSSLKAAGYTCEGRAGGLEWNGAKAPKQADQYLLNDSYCRDISIKVRSQLDIKRRKGEFIGGYAMYGYCKDERNKSRLVVDEYAADVVRSIYRRKLEGMSAKVIAEQLNSEGVLAPSEYKRLCGLNYHSGFKAGTHAKWQAIQVLRILKNEVYTGTMVQGKRQKINYKIKKIRDVEESGWIKVPNMHEAIIPQKLFDTVQEVLKLDTCASKGQQTVNLFSGMVRCGGCGQNMVRRTVSKNGKKYVYLHCITNHNGLGCSSHLISESKLAEVVLAALQGKIQQISGLEQRLDEINEIPKNQRRLKSVEEHMKMLEQEEQKYQTLRRQLYEDMSSGIVSKDEYKEFSRSFNEKVENICKAKTEMNRQLDSLSNLDVEHLPWIEDFKSYQNLTSLNRRVLVELVESITVYDKEHIHIQYRFDQEIRNVLEYCNSVPTTETEGSTV